MDCLLKVDFVYQGTVQLFKIRYTVYFYGNKSDNDSGIFLSLPFKDVTSFDTIYTKGILNPDMLQIVMASKMTVNFGNLRFIVFLCSIF